MKLNKNLRTKNSSHDEWEKMAMIITRKSQVRAYLIDPVEVWRQEVFGRQEVSTSQ